jgi:hypothetical protein
LNLFCFFLSQRSRERAEKCKKFSKYSRKKTTTEQHVHPIKMQNNEEREGGKEGDEKMQHMEPIRIYSCLTVYKVSVLKKAKLKKSMRNGSEEKKYKK